MKRLCAKFADRRICKCGAPAELIGRPTTRDGVDGYLAQPITYGGQTYTHLCSRQATPDELYECGVLRLIDTRMVGAESMPDWCFEDDSPTQRSLGGLRVGKEMMP